MLKSPCVSVELGRHGKIKSGETERVLFDLTFLL